MAVAELGQARIAVVGAGSPAGALLREALAEQGVSGERVDLYGAAPHDGEAQLSEYGGEARLIQEPDVGEISGHDVIFLCEGGEVARHVARGAAAPTVVFDMVSALPLESTDGPFHPELTPGALDPRARPYRVAHPIATLIAEALHPIEQGPGIVEAFAVVLRPAADFGEAGVEELREQVVRLLNFTEVPVSTFGRQLAFNVLNQRQLGDAEADLEGRLVADVTRMLDWGEPRIACRLVTAPIFYGHCLQLRVRTREATDVARLTELLGAGGEAETPLELSTENRVSVSPPLDDGLGGYWIWLTAGEAGARGMRQTLKLARAVSGI